MEVVKCEAVEVEVPADAEGMENTRIDHTPSRPAISEDNGC